MDVPNVHVPSPEPDDGLKTKEQPEEKAFAMAQAQEGAELRALQRREGVSDVLYKVLTRVLSWTPLVVLAIAVTMGWHYLGPSELGWLNDGQINRIENFFSGGAIAALFFIVRQYTSRR